MTPQKQEQTNPMFHYFQMEDLVPEDHILRQIDEAVDFSFVRDVASDCYCPDNGRPGIDPELVVRMILIGYLYNLSENRLCQEVGMHAAYRLFCHQTFDDAVPDRSTINKLRNHKWASSGLFERIMRQAVQCCIDVGLVSGKHLSVDGTQIQADASVKSIEPIEPPVSLDDYLKGIGFEGDKTKGRSGHPQDKDFHGEKWTNQTHRSTTDPDARLYSKSKGKGAFLWFMGHDLIDTKSRVILETQGTQATGTAEPESALKMADDLEAYTMPKDIQTLSADAGCGSGNFIADVLDRGIIPHIPLRADEKIEPIPAWKNKTNSAHIQAERDRKVREAKARNHARSISLTADCKLSRRLRKRSEHIFAEAKQQHGMGRARYRGLASLNEQLNLVAAVQNLKRLVSFIRRGKASMCALSVKDSASCSSNSSYSLLTRTLIRLFCLFHSKTIRYATL